MPLVLTEIAAVFAPVLHKYVPPPLAVNVLLVVVQVSVVADAEIFADGADSLL